MKTFLQAASLVALSLTVLSCATLNKNECLTADWRAIGHGDGSRGYHAHRFNDHQKACSKHKITADFDAYQNGHQQGLRRYCIPETGYNLGKYNKSMPNICPVGLAEAVRKGYNLGKIVFQQKYQLKQKIKRLETDLAAMDDNLDRLLSERTEHEDYLALAEENIYNPKLGKLEKLIFYTQREEIRKMIRDKDEEISELETDRLPIIHSIEDLEAEVQQLNAQPMPRLR